MSVTAIVGCIDCIYVVIFIVGASDFTNLARIGVHHINAFTIIVHGGDLLHAVNFVLWREQVFIRVGDFSNTTNPPAGDSVQLAETNLTMALYKLFTYLLSYRRRDFVS